MSEQIRVVEIWSVENGSGYTDDSLGSILTELENAFVESVEAEYRIRFKHMSRKLFEALPEFQGF